MNGRNKNNRKALSRKLTFMYSRNSVIQMRGQKKLGWQICDACQVTQSVDSLLASEAPSKRFLAQSSSKHSLVSQPQQTPLSLWMVIK